MVRLVCLILLGQDDLVRFKLTAVLLNRDMTIELPNAQHHHLPPPLASGALL
jgi:hypothetical protein